MTANPADVEKRLPCFGLPSKSHRVISILKSLNQIDIKTDCQLLWYSITPLVFLFPFLARAYLTMGNSSDTR